MQNILMTVTEILKVLSMTANAYSICAIVTLGPLWFFLARNKMTGRPREEKLIHEFQYLTVNEHFLIAVMLFTATQAFDLGIVPMSMIYYYLL